MIVIVTWAFRGEVMVKFSFAVVVATASADDVHNDNIVVTTLPAMAAHVGPYSPWPFTLAVMMLMPAITNDFGEYFQTTQWLSDMGVFI